MTVPNVIRDYLDLPAFLFVTSRNSVQKIFPSIISAKIGAYILGDDQKCMKDIERSIENGTLTCDCEMECKSVETQKTTFGRLFSFPHYNFLLFVLVLTFVLFQIEKNLFVYSVNRYDAEITTSRWPADGFLVCLTTMG